MWWSGVGGPGGLAAVDFSQLPRDLDTLGMDGAIDPTTILLAAFERCGTIELVGVDGRWSATERDWADAVIANGRIEAGSSLRQELCAIHVVERCGTRAVYVTVRHEDVHDPGDAWLAYLSLDRHGDALTACVGSDLDHLAARCVELTRSPE